MNRLKLLIATLLLTATAFGQFGPANPGPAYRGKRPTDPATCTTSMWYYSTATNTFKFCSAVNTWSALGGASSPLTLTAAAAGDRPLLLKLAASQTANAFEVQPNGSTTPLLTVTAGGTIYTSQVAAAGTMTPTFSTATDTDTGLVFSGSNLWAFTRNNVPDFGTVGTAQIGGDSTFQLVWNNTVNGVYGAGADTGLGRFGATVVKTTNGGASISYLMGGGAAVASAATLPLPSGSVFHVSGTTTITSITSTNLVSGVFITLIFDGALTVTDNNTTLNLASNFVTTADDTLTLVYDGTNWREVARSVN